ncbi:MAG: SDR family oxidoreductase [Clostridia bacterium]|nr:SDR family oxidoreductase [Clostridia bacterium]
MKTAVVTGSVKGIGKSIGLKLLREGCFVIFNYATDDEAASQLNEELCHEFVGKYKIIQSDLSNIDNVNDFADACVSTIHKIDYLVLNAGRTERSPFGSVELESWNEVMNVNLNMPFFLVQKLSANMNENGKIIFIGSIMGIEPHAMSISYGVSKAGVHFLVKSLVKVFASRRITVNAVVPGFVDTLWQKTKAADHRKRIEDKIALNRFALPEEIADAVYTVLQNDYINGSIVRVDGGYDYK